MSITPQESNEWIQHIITIIAVIVGGGITYLSNYLFERRKRKKTKDERRANEVYIPLCSAFEEYIDFFYDDKRPNRDHFDYGTVPYTLLKGNEWDRLYSEIKRSRSAKFRYFLLSSDRKMIDDLYLEIDSILVQIEDLDDSIISAGMDLAIKLNDEKAKPEDIDISEYKNTILLAALSIPIEKMYEPLLDKEEIEMIERELNKLNDMTQKLVDKLENTRKSLFAQIDSMLT